VVIVEHVMGMPVVVDVRDDDGEASDLFDWLRFVDETFSTYKPDSDVSRIARGELRPDQAHPLVGEVLDECERLREETRGYFDARAGGTLDPSGLVKGWAVERGAQLLVERGLRSFAINAGGDIRLVGDEPWRVGIQHPVERDKVAKVIESGELAIATSGAYLRGDHVLNPHTRTPPRGVLSVTITGPDLAIADAYATAAFAMGERGPWWTARLAGYEAMTILADGRVLSTPGFPAVPDHENAGSVALSSTSPTDSSPPEGASEPLGGAST
jgi:thiamine biosynthesis lipoprotein